MELLLLLLIPLGLWRPILCVDNEILDQGRFQYDVIKRESTSLPKYGGCWKNALKDLEAGCRTLTDELQSRLALSFANCFLAKSGQKTYPCDRHNDDVADCLRGVDANAFTAYSNFFTHTHNMCQFLQSQMWHEATEEAISGLTTTSQKVAETLANSSHIQDEIIKHQLDTLEYQKQIAASGDMLGKAMEQSRGHVRDMMHELRASTDEQRMLIFSVFDRVSKLQSMVLSEVSWLYTVLFYGGCLLALYLATATKRTADARLYLFVILSSNVAAERWVCSITLGDATFDGVFEDENSSVATLLHTRIWLARKVALALSCLVLAYVAATFKDYNIINNQLLQDIRRQNADLQKAVELMKGLSQDSTDSQPVSTFGGQLSDDDDDQEEDDDDHFSYCSNVTDSTWVALTEDFSDIEEEDDLTMDEEDFATATNSANTTPTNEAVLDLHNESLVRCRTPDVVNVASIVNGGDQAAPKRRGRPKGSRNSSRSGTPLRNSVPRHAYNLRHRRNPLEDNPMLDDESPNAFGKFITKMANISQKNSKRVREALQQEMEKEATKKTPALAALSDDEMS